MGVFIGVILFFAIGISVLVYMIKATAHVFGGGPKVDSIPDSALQLPLINPFAVLFVDGALLILRDEKGRDKTIPISSIQTIRFDPPTKFSNGSICLSIPKSPTGAVGLGGGATVLVGNEDERYIFKPDYSEDAQKIVVHIQSAMSFQHVPASAPPSFTDEIAKLKALLDSGAITQVEFETAKKKLLE